jgi:hypothetical protein
VVLLLAIVPGGVLLKKIYTVLDIALVVSMNRTGIYKRKWNIDRDYKEFLDAHLTSCIIGVPKIFV